MNLLTISGDEVGTEHGGLKQLSNRFRLRKPGHSSLASYAFFECVCGSVVLRRMGNVIQGITTSCGCFSKEQTIERNTIHGGWSVYRDTCTTWQKMLNRCGYSSSTRMNPRNDAYIAIDVCDRWLSSFENFLADMGPKPSSEHSIDRERSEEGYHPGNCRWLPLLENISRRHR